MKENAISYDIRGAAFMVYNNLCPGLLESVYENALALELLNFNHHVERQVGFPVKYGTIFMNIGFRIDILVDKSVIIEVKSVEQLIDVHKKQLLTYLKLTGLKLGLLINFNTDNLSKSIIRIIN